MFVYIYIYYLNLSELNVVLFLCSFVQSVLEVVAIFLGPNAIDAFTGLMILVDSVLSGFPRLSLYLIIQITCPNHHILVRRYLGLTAYKGLAQ